MRLVATTIAVGNPTSAKLGEKWGTQRILSRVAPTIPLFPSRTKGLVVARKEGNGPAIAYLGIPGFSAVQVCKSPSAH